MDLLWIRPNDLIRHPQGAEYATDGEHVYMRTNGPHGRYLYRKASWQSIAVDVEWADVPESVWTDINEVGEPVDPQKMEQPKGPQT